MRKFEIIKKEFTTINMYRDYGLSVEGICDLIAKEKNFFSELQESFDGEKTARDFFDEKYRPLAISKRVEDWHTMLVSIVFYDLLMAEYDESGELISDRKLLDRAVEALPAEGQEKNTYEKIGTWQGNMDLERFQIEKLYENDYQLKEKRRKSKEAFRKQFPGLFRNIDADVDEKDEIDLIKFTDKHKRDLYGRVFALYGFVDNPMLEFYRFCWEVNPDNLTEALNEDKIYLFYPIHKEASGIGPNGETWDGISMEIMDFDVVGPNSEFVVYKAEFDVPDDFNESLYEEDIEEIFIHHPSPAIRKIWSFKTPYEANKTMSSFYMAHERKDNRVYFQALFLQEENEKGVRFWRFRAPDLYKRDK